MPAQSPPATARAQLAQFVQAARTPSAAAALAARFGALPSVGARSAAVLMLFGVLDAVASDRRDASSAVSRDLDVLLLARASTLRAHPGQVAFPGGRIDPGDAGAVGAAVREAHEETGLDPAGVDVLGALPEVPLAFSGHMVTPVLAWWQHPSAVGVVDAGESSDVFRAPVADLLDPAQRGVTVVHRDGEEWRGPAFLIAREGGEHLVWGFTGMLLDGLFELLGWSEPWDRSRVLPLADPRVGS